MNLVQGWMLCLISSTLISGLPVTKLTQDSSLLLEDETLTAEDLSKLTFKKLIAPCFNQRYMERVNYVLANAPKGHPALRSAEIAMEFYSEVDSGCCGAFLVFLSWVLVVCTFPFSMFYCFKVVTEYERAVIFRLGRLLPGGARGPGLFFILPCTDQFSKVDLRVVSFNVPPQEILTKDSVTVAVDAVVYFRISNPTISVCNVQNSSGSTQLLAQTSLRTILGTKSLAEILTDREQIAAHLQETLDHATNEWGVKVERVEVKDVRLPQNLQRAMAAEAEASREARAKVVAAEGEQKASRALKEAAEVISESPTALQLRYLQTLNTIAAERNSTIVFPIPIELLSHLKQDQRM